MNKIIKRAFVDAIGTTAYIILIVSLIFSTRNFPKVEDTPFIPIAMLLLFVCSAAITGFLVFGKPIMLYIDGKKREAITMLTHTVGMMVFFTVIAFVILITYLNLL